MRRKRKTKYRACSQSHFPSPLVCWVKMYIKLGRKKALTRLPAWRLPASLWKVLYDPISSNMIQQHQLKCKTRSNKLKGTEMSTSYERDWAESPDQVNASHLKTKRAEGDECICFQLQCGKMLYSAGGQLHPSQKTHMGRKHILYSERLQHKSTVALRDPPGRIHCWRFPISKSDYHGRPVSKHLISTSRYLTWLRISEIHFLEKQSTVRSALGLLPL